MDTHRDRQVLKGLMVELTNISFVAKLQNIQNRMGTRNASNSFLSNLKLYETIRKTSQIVRSNLTNVQQYKLTERIISSRKLKEIRTIGEGRGRKLKSQEFPELALALLSLKKPPRTGLAQLVINLHWSTANVNLLINSAHNKPECVVISKDAKAIVSCDNAPVQRPGHSWKKRMELLDHTWDQSRINSITPMTFLFLQTEIRQLPASSVELLHLQTSDTTTLHLTRTGQGVTLLNLSLYEPETTFRCLNEILFLLTLSAFSLL